MTSASHRPRPIFVVGYMHSGTTLMANVFRNHPDVFCPDGETKFFLHLDLVRRHVGEATPSDLEAFAREVIEEGFPLFEQPRRRKSVVLRSADIGVAFDRAMSAIAAEQGRARWAEKTPTHVFKINQILEGVPDATFIELVRDPRDVLASKKTRALTVWTSGRYSVEQRARKHLEKSFDPLWDSLSWVSAVRAGAAAQRATRWMRIRYEDLIDDPGSTVAEACDFLDLTFDPSLLDVDRGIPADPDELRSGHRGVAQSSIGRWRHVLDPTEIAMCERAALREMDALAYRREASVGSAPLVLRLIRRSVPALFVRMYHQYRLGGSAYLGEVVKALAGRLRVMLGR